MFNGQTPPLFYDHINSCESQKNPAYMHVQNTGLFRFFQRYLLQKAMSPFKFTLPKTWSKDYVMYVLYLWGYFTVFNTDRFGVIPQQCGLYGYDVFYRPTHAVISNPLFDRIYYTKIGTQCTLVKLQPDYGGVYDLVSYYAEMMALCAESVAVSLVNSKMAYVFFGENQKEGQELRKIYDQVNQGDAAVFTSKKWLDENGKPTWTLFDRDLKQSYLVDDILKNMREIEDMFNTDIGIPNANTDKKERMITSEVQSNNIETQSKCEIWLEELQASFEETRNMFGIGKDELNVEWRFGGGLDASDSISLGLVPTQSNVI